jgi:hypothetical protein
MTKSTKALDTVEPTDKPLNETAKRLRGLWLMVVYEQHFPLEAPDIKAIWIH